MEFLRYLLIIASAAGAAFPLYLLMFERGGSPAERFIVARLCDRTVTELHLSSVFSAAR